LARTVGPDDYGIFIFALSFGTLYALLIRFDFLSYLTREIPLSKEGGPKKFHSVLGTQIWLVLFSTCILLPVLYFLPKPQTEKLAIALIAGAMVFQALKSPLRGALRGFDKYHIDSLIMLNERSMLLAIAVAAFIYSWNLTTVCIAFLLVRCIDYFISLIILSRQIRPRLIVSVQQSLTTVKKAWPFATTMLLFMIYNYSDSIMIYLFRPSKELGFYNVAYQLLEGSQIFPSSITGGLLPLLTINYIQHTEYASSLLEFSIEVMFYLAFPIVVFCSLYSTELISLLYGEEYLQSVIALRIIIWSIPVFFLSTVARCAFYAAQREKLFAKIFGLSVIFNIIINIPFIYYYGFVGACISTFLTEFLVCIILFSKFSTLLYNYDLLKTIKNPLLLNIIIFIIMFILLKNELNIILSGIFMIIIYLSSIYFFKLITLEEINKIRSPL
jgi:O-antigen/teichoic acid export membrane protein